MNHPVQSLMSMPRPQRAPPGMGRGGGMMGGMGRGMRPAAPYMPAAGGGNLGTNTSDANPEAVNCRVFVGNLNTIKVSREDLESIFRRYGVITAVSTHKGYGFIQFTNPMEARAAVQGEDQRVYAEQKLDCNIVSEPKFRPRKRRPAADNTGGVDQGEYGAKRTKLEGGPATNGTVTGGNDVLICGNCKWLFRDVQALAKHKTQPCEQKTTCKCAELGDVPSTLTCATCSCKFETAWELIQHCQTDHAIMIYYQ